ncbi:hypothetical protein Z046_26205 [Pseudomonas aeruginosa VRFPA09]|nr:hypothetical protein Z046_26205 [Pseudomonas aeruginosa VRFPA09]
MPVIGDGIDTKQPFSHFTQGRARQGRVERLQSVQFQQGRQGWSWPYRGRRWFIASSGQLVQFGRQRLITLAERGASPDGIDVGQAILQTGSDHQPQAAAWPPCNQNQAPAIVDQMLAARKAPELEGVGIWRWISVRIELKYGVVVGKPGRMRLARIQGWIFQQAQSPAPSRLWSATPAQPVVAVIGVTAQVFPRQRRTIQV